MAPKPDRTLWIPAMGDEEPMKKKRRYSRERDLEVVVEGEVFRVHSHDLMVASDVFATMLQSDMCESEQGRISLEGESKDEFCTLLRYICSKGGAALPDINKQTCEVLLKWADKYQINGLIERCEQFLKNEMCGDGKKDVLGGLRLAIEYKLVGLQQIAAGSLASDLFKYRHDLVHFAENPAIMQIVLPKLFAAAGIETKMELPTDSVEIKHVWPLVARSLEVIVWA